MGGPYWAAKDAGAWSIPKGEFDEGDEAALDAALREFGGGARASDAPDVAVRRARHVRLLVGQAGHGVRRRRRGLRSADGRVRRVRAGVAAAVGRTASFPEVDRAEWTWLDAARERLVKGQRPAIDALEGHSARWPGRSLHAGLNGLGYHSASAVSVT